MPQLAERVHMIRRRPAAKEKRPPIAEVQQTRSTGLARMRGPVSERVASPVSEIVGGLPARLRAGVESLSGIAMDDVRVHRNSSEPAKLGALAFTRGTQIHLAPGQDEHLPHEAWHVVQQKQGRVQATTQMKGVGVADHPALEAEADAMGGRALSITSKQPPLRRVSVSGAAPAQLKLKKWQKTPLEKTDADAATYSAVTLRHIRHGTSFVLRDDVEPQSKVIHVLEEGKKYLLGEFHGSGKWEKDITNWPIDKMREQSRRIPHIPSDTAGAFDPSSDAQNLPLEDTRAYFLAVTLLSQASATHLSAQATIKNWKKNRSFLKNVKEAQEFAHALENNLGDFRAFHRKFEKNPSQEADSKAVDDFSKKLEQDFQAEISDLKSTMDALVFHIENPDKVSAQSDSVETKLASLGPKRPMLAKLAGDLATSLGIGGKRRLKKIQEASSVKGAALSFNKAFDATDRLREDIMATNIAAAVSPLLVQLGNVHANALAGRKELKATVVLVDKSVPLQKITKKS